LDVQTALPLTSDAPSAELHTLVAAIEKDSNQNAAPLLASKKRACGVNRETIFIDGVDGNSIKLIIFRPESVEDTTSTDCIVYIHGGGMMFFSAECLFYQHLSEDMASTLNCTVIAVEFRNSGGELGPHPFPAGLHDCRSALEWVHAQKGVRNFSRIVLCGESGGANLSIALTLLMKSENKVHYIDGLYAMCPFISGLYAAQETDASKQLPSLRGFDHCGIVDLAILDIMARLYDPEQQHTRNPLAWPYWATVQDLTGFPPSVVSLNEADPLYDEGLDFYRKLLKAGVAARCRSLIGTPHAGDILGMSVLPLHSGPAVLFTRSCNSRTDNRNAPDERTLLFQNQAVEVVSPRSKRGAAAFAAGEKLQRVRF
jgi:acetyl esterase/lipase